MPTGVDLDEEERVHLNRLEHFLTLGFTTDQAETLAGSPVDWHDVRVLVLAGCPPHLAFRIVL